MKKTLCIASTCLLLSAPSHADRLLGVFAGAYTWNQNYDGSIQDLDTIGGGTNIDLENTLGFDDEDGNVIYVALEHPVPVLPNIRLQQTELEIDSQNNAAGTINFGDQTFTVNVDADLDLSHTDATLYWQVLDNYVSLDLGLTARFFDGELNLTETGGGTSANEKLEAVIPLIYTKARVDLPLSGLYAAVSGNFLGDGDNNFLDYEAKIGYESDFKLGVEAGFRSLKLDLDDVDDVEADITIDGLYLGLFFHL
jgi:outer membrane protein